MLSEHPYLYSEHEPVNLVDPSGYFKAEIFIVIAICNGLAGAMVGAYSGSTMGPGGAVAGGIIGAVAGVITAVPPAWEEGDASRLWNWITRIARAVVREFADDYADHPGPR